MPEPDYVRRRQEYADQGLHEADLTADPISMFGRWWRDAEAAGVPMPTALVVATASAAGVPSSRMVLLKEVTERGFVFYTNLESRKAGELAAEPRCALLFPWVALDRQVRVEGTASLVSRAEVAAYFVSRPRGSQIGAWASPQSRPVSGRDELATRYAEMTARFEGGEVPVPDSWGGYVVVPDAVEFWQGRPGRMHDRLVYTRQGDGRWEVGRLAP